MATHKTQVGNILTRLKNNRVIAILIVIGTIVIAIASFSNATHKIIKQVDAFFSNRPTAIKLRHTPMIISDNEVKVVLAKHGFYERRWNPSGKGIVHRYESQIRNDTAVLIDASTGLMWQKGGSSAGMAFTETEQYIQAINAKSFAGFNDWRIPTVEEAMSLMEPKPYDRFHIAPEFERGINFIWTSDYATNGRVWLLYFYDGMLGLEQDSFNAWVRLVR